MAAIFFLLFAIFSGIHCQSPISQAKLSSEEQKALDFVNRAEKEMLELGRESVIYQWAYATNITDENEKKQLEFQLKSDRLSLTLGKEAKLIDMNAINDKNIKRKLESISQIGTSILEDNELERYNKITNDMEKIYSTAKVKDYHDKSKLVSLEPEITLRMGESRDPDELEYYWNEHRAETGAKFRDLFKEYIKLTNKAAKLNGFKDGAEMKTYEYESDTFVQEMEETWQGLMPLYEQLHSYVRYHLNKKYGSDLVDLNGPIPAHLLGNMWAQQWNNIEALVKPYANKPSIDVTDEMVKQGWTVKTMFDKADEFFVSMGFEPMTQKFWEKSMLEKPEGREVVCHASAWDFYLDDDFRIKMCTRVNQEDFTTVNHEMGHIQYFMQYRNQSYLFRDGANPGFHEGVADILSLAVGTASYYKKLGLLGDDVDVADEETNINILLSMALQRLAFMPFGYVVDKYRWDLYSGKADLDDMNCHWVKLRSQIQGVKPPNVRSENHFDPGAKYHVAANVGYVRYFTAFVYEFQFYRALCLVSKQYVPNDPSKPLHRCNFYGSKAAGDKLMDMLELGASKPWKEVMEIMTGQPKMDTSAFREYFRPLEDWLVKENARNKVKVGWTNPPLETMCNKSGGSSTEGDS